MLLFMFLTFDCKRPCSASLSTAKFTVSKAQRRQQPRHSHTKTAKFHSSWQVGTTRVFPWVVTLVYHWPWIAGLISAHSGEINKSYSMRDCCFPPLIEIRIEIMPPKYWLVVVYITLWSRSSQDVCPSYPLHQWVGIFSQPSPPIQHLYRRVHCAQTHKDYYEKESSKFISMSKCEKFIDTFHVSTASSSLFP